MNGCWKIGEFIVMYIVTTIALLFVFAVLTGAVSAHPNKSCHKHGAATHCK